jgi:hypothetical protein
MRFCTTCGQQLKEGIRFCTGCGNPVRSAPADDVPIPEPAQIPEYPTVDVAASGYSSAQAPPRPSAPPDDSPTVEAPSRHAPPVLPLRQPPADVPPVRPPPSSQRPRGPADAPPRWSRGRLAVVAAITALIVGGGAAAAVLLSRGHQAAPAGLGSSATPSSSRAVVTQPSVTGSASPTSASTPTAGNGQVSVAASLTGNPLVPPVVGLLDKYFTAINHRDYQGYISLLTPQEQQGLTIGQFDSGYRSTRDSAEILQSISTAGGTVATVTFTSHQNPADSYNHQQSCTSWRISLFLQPNGSTYLIGKPPPSYHASYAACP